MYYVHVFLSLFTIGKKGKEKQTIDTIKPDNEDTETGQTEEMETRYLNWKIGFLFLYTNTIQYVCTHVLCPCFSYFYLQI